MSKPVSRSLEEIKEICKGNRPTREIFLVNLDLFGTLVTFMLRYSLKERGFIATLVQISENSDELYYASIAVPKTVITGLQQYFENGYGITHVCNVHERKLDPVLQALFTPTFVPRKTWQ